MIGDEVIDHAQAVDMQLEHERRGDLLMWGVFKHPVDYPQDWVARPALIAGGPIPLFVVLLADSLDELREELPSGLTRIGYQGDPTPLNYVESWL